MAFMPKPLKVTHIQKDMTFLTYVFLFTFPFLPLMESLRSVDHKRKSEFYMEKSACVNSHATISWKFKNPQFSEDITTRMSFKCFNLHAEATRVHISWSSSVC